MEKHRNTFIIIDGNAILHRAWHALPPLMTKQGVLVNAAYGFTMLLLKVLREMTPEAIAVAWDTKEDTFRDKAFAAYKAQRTKKPQELYDQIPLIKKVLAAFRIRSIECPGWEADDIIGTLVTRATHDTGTFDTFIVTGDLDALQLVNDHTRVLTLKKGVSETAIYDVAAVRERFGLSPAQMIDYKALRGDPSDNIPGVKGIGEKTATTLLREFDALDNLYAHLDAPTIAAGVRAKLAAGREDAALAKTLVTIVRDAPIDATPNDCLWTGYDKEDIFPIFQELEFRTLLTRLPTKGQGTDDTVRASSQLPEARSNTQGHTFLFTKNEQVAFLAEVRRQKIIVFDTETTSLNTREAKLIGVSMSWQAGTAAYCDVRDGVPDALRAIIEDATIEKVGHNTKYDIEVLTTNGMTPRGFVFDTMIASYILNASTRQHNLDTLAFQHFGIEKTPTEALIGTGKKQITMAQVPREKVAAYACEDADVTWRLYEKFKSEIETQGFHTLFFDMEMPLVAVLVAMETAGIKIDTNVLSRLKTIVTVRLATLEHDIHAAAGGAFNISSPKQLKEVLFDRLALSTKGIGKTKTGLSTAADELEKLVDVHPIIPKILEYRELEKLRSTYIDALPVLIDRTTGRIHTSFNQTVAATGRLSSSDPNLQNIPIRTEFGNEIRTAFVADAGMVLLAADYSQIELRLAAHLSNDERMIAAFKNNEDIHAATAAAINEVPVGAVTSQMRAAAKAVNFGILYGMGASHLARSTGLSRDAARSFIEKYFVVYNGLAKYIEETKALARSLGYAETMFGRRRPLPEIRSNVPMVRAAAERMAMNMPMQGSQADILKIAMIRIHEQLTARPPLLKGEGWGEVRMLLQVHDELVFEVPSDGVDALAQMVRQTMESVAKLRVPLVVDVKTGRSWGAMERL